MKYNLLTEPWIPVRDKQNRIFEMGILEVFQKAPELVEITDSYSHQEFGMYRLLMTLLMDIFHPRRIYDIEDMISEGEFDLVKIQEYLSECEQEEVSFDIFDEKRPFLQVPLSAWDNAKATTSIANLNPIFPSGNNHIHFNHSKEYETIFSYAEAARALSAVFVFCTAGAQGYPSSVNGAPPIYTIVKGNNLFETLVFGMVPSNQYENYDDEVVLWKSKEIIETKKEVASTSLLRGLVFPTRRITLLPEEGYVRRMYFAQGENYVGYSSFIDPYVSYVNTDKGRSNVKPRLEIEPWRNIATLLNCDSKTAPLIVQQYKDVTDRNTISVNTYNMITSNASYVDVFAGEYSIPIKILQSPMLMASLQNAIENAEKEAKCLGRAFKELKEELNLETQKVFDSQINATMAAYYEECGEKLFSDYISNLKLEEDIVDLEKQWKKSIWILSWQMYDSFLELVGINGKLLMKSEPIRSKKFFRQEGGK